MSFSVVCMVNHTAISVVDDVAVDGGDAPVTVAWSNDSSRAPDSARPAYHTNSNGSVSSGGGQCGRKAAEASAVSYQVRLHE